MLKNRIFLSFLLFVIVFAGFSNQVFCSDSAESLRRTPIVEVYEKTHDTVVNISGTRVVTSSYSSGYNLPDIFDLWGPRLKREVSVLGSGVVVHEDGYVMTNAHVIEHANNIKVIFSNGDEFPAEVIAHDENKDIALVKIEADKKLPFVHLGRTDDLMIGETVIAIGNPLGYSNTLTSGILSAIDRDIQVSEGTWLRGLIQTDAPINPGNSGGPLFNITGDLIGINTAIAADAENIGFAIPVDIIADNLRQMLMPEKLRRVRLGLNVGRVKTLGQYTGLTVDSVTKSSPADDKGMKDGDIVLEVDGHELSNIIDFYITMMSKNIGEPIKIKYARASGSSVKTDTVTLTIQDRPLPDGRKLAQDFFGMNISVLTNQVAKKFGFESAYPVLIIVETQDSGVADTAGLEPGDLVLGINGTTIQSVEGLSIEMEKINPGDAVSMTIMRIGIGPFGQVQRRYSVRLRALSK